MTTKGALTSQQLAVHRIAPGIVYGGSKGMPSILSGGIYRKACTQEQAVLFSRAQDGLQSRIRQLSTSFLEDADPTLKGALERQFRPAPEQRHLDNLLDLVEEQRQAISDLSEALGAGQEGRLCMCEANEGTVVRVVDDDVVVRYDTCAGRLEQLYDRQQFVGGRFPREGDRFEARIFAWTSPQETPRGIESFLTEEELAHVKRADARRGSGPVEI